MGGSKGQRTGLPSFTGTATYSDRLGRFEFRYPWGWEPDDLEDGLEGVNLMPEADDPATYFAISVKDLEIAVEAGDLDDVRSGFDAGLAQLDDLEIIDSADDLFGNIVRLDRTFTFTEDGETRMRHVWAMFVDRWQLVIVYQGSTVDEYEYWLPMGNYIFNTFKLPEALWFATDPSMHPKIPDDVSDASEHAG